MGIFDFLKKEELKKIDVLTLENEKINKMYKELSETKLSIEQMSVLELQKNISEKTNDLYPDLLEYCKVLRSNMINKTTKLIKTAIENL